MGDDSVFGDCSPGLLSVPSIDGRPPDFTSSGSVVGGGGILRRSTKTPVSLQSVVDLIDFHDEVGSGEAAMRAKSQSSLSDHRLYGMEGLLNSIPNYDVNDSPNSFDEHGLMRFDAGAANILHRCHSDTNIAYFCVEEVGLATMI